MPYYKNKCENIEEFLLSFGSTQIEGFTFQGHPNWIQNVNYNSEDENSLYFEDFPCSNYFYGLRDAISKAAMYVWIDRILLSGKEFSAIVRAAKHAKILFLTNCKITTDAECELGQMEGWQIQFLTVECYFHAYKLSRYYEDNYMKIFLSIISCQHLLRSLKRIQFNCGRDMREMLISKAEEILDSDYDIQMLIIEV